MPQAPLTRETHMFHHAARLFTLALIAAVGCAEQPQQHTPSTAALVKTSTPQSPAPAVRAAQAVLNEPISYNRDIRPILSDNCFLCHGPDERMRDQTGGLRLDIRDEAIAFDAIVPGDPDASLLVRHITSERARTVMPPPSSNLTLTEDEIALLTRWIAEGADYEDHWAFITPQRPAVPEAGAGWARNDIDRFIHARLDAEGLAPSEPADKATLLRRVTLALTGLPPTPDEVDAFLADESEDAYENAVDRLLESPRFGEHQSRYWLDAVRYADTHGLHLDNERNVWPYRDWVINSFNQNLPYNDFVEQQLAGDLMPDPTTDQLVASGFIRMNPTTGEGGAIDEEYLVKYAVDRVDTVSTVFLGMTVACAQCHDHKFDPISQREFFELYAYFNSTAEAAMDGNAIAPPPSIRVVTDAQRAEIAALNQQAQTIESQITQRIASIDYHEPADLETRPAPELPAEVVWIEDDIPAGANPQGNGQNPNWRWVTAPDHPVYAGTRATHREAPGLNQHFFINAADPLIIHEGDTLFAWVYLDPANPPETIQLQFNNGDWNHRAYWGANKAHASNATGHANHEAGPLPPTGQWVKLEVPAATVGLNPGDRVHGWAFTQFGGSVYYDHAGVSTMHPADDRYKTSRTLWEVLAKDDANTPHTIRTTLALPMSERTAEQDRAVLDYYLRHAHEATREQLAPLEAERMQLLTQAQQIEAMAPTTLVAKELDTPRPAHILNRGEYDQPGEVVQRGTPAALPPMPDDAPANRLGFAHWLTNPSHPLTARVTVNRIWQQYFGTGIVETSEDFGSQGAWPSHPELLDWLAVEFIESGWDTKHIHRLIVTSAAYRQTSQVSPRLLEADPDNRLIARGPRYRLDAEVVRDQALFAAGLLVEHVGGPSVKPYQPEGLWEAVGYESSNTVNFVRGNGDDLYRRSLYTFWKRTSPPPSLSMFDAPSRESCTVRRSRTNTPLQALVTLNDIQYVEAARVMAQRVMQEAGNTASTQTQIAYAFKLVTSRDAQPRELAVLRSIYDQQLAVFTQDPDAADELLAVGEAPVDDTLPAAQLAAMTLVTNTLLNLDETLTQH
ncbi:MAG: PSD1 and planctomycete cytochrome C domain-containing protein [Phycisphaerales bacterium JB063]